MENGDLMTSATVMLTITRPNLQTPWQSQYILNGSDPECQRFKKFFQDDYYLSQLATVPPFVVDNSYTTASDSAITKADGWTFVFGEELGPGRDRSLTRTCRYIVQDTGLVPGWSTDPQELYQLYIDNKSDKEHVIDASGEFNAMILWLEQYKQRTKCVNSICIL